MEDQQTEMIHLDDVVAREKYVATRVQKQLLKQIGALRKSRSSPTAEENARTLPSAPHTRESAHSTGSSRRDRSGTHVMIRISGTQSVHEP